MRKRKKLLKSLKHTDGIEFLGDVEFLVDVEYLDVPKVKKKNHRGIFLIIIIMIMFVSFGTIRLYNKHINVEKASLEYNGKPIYIKGNGYYKKYTDNILNGADPELEENMIPVYYDNGSWKKADLYQKWYSYEDLNWANVVVVKSDLQDYYNKLDVNSIIDMNDIRAFFVWIPRFEYKLFNVELAPVSEQMIEVNFVSSDTPKKTTIANGLYYTHPAFSTDDGELNGFWIAKFEPSLNGDTIDILPGKRTLVNINMADMWYYATNVSNRYNLSIQSRIITNMEYGAIAYLSYSQYSKLNNNDYIGTTKRLFLNNAMGTSVWENVTTGCSAGGSIVGGAFNCLYNYDVPYYGTGASTTGTVYGIYDIAGGSWECVMGIVSGYPINNNLGGYNGILPDNKRYYTFYTNGERNDYSRSIIGDAMGEVLSNQIIDKSWNGNNAFFATDEYPWVKRGGSFRGGSYSGIFDFGITDALARGDKTFRVILSKY